MPRAAVWCAAATLLQAAVCGVAADAGSDTGARRRAKSQASCPDGTTQVDVFSAEGAEWIACEDLSTPGGGIALVPTDAAAPSQQASNRHDTSEHAKQPAAVWLPKTHEPYSQGTDDEYYLGLGKTAVLQAKWDALGDALLHGCHNNTAETGTTTDDHRGHGGAARGRSSVRELPLCEPTWSAVERALPVMRYSQGNRQASGNAFMCSPYSPESGVRTFTGSRSASVDATFSDHADDCTDNGFPRPQGYVMNLTAIANGEPPVTDWFSYVNFTGMAEGLVGGVLPNLVFYFPILPQNFSGFGGSRFWTMVASPVPDMQGGREQSVWFRFQQVVCDGARGQPPCTLKGKPQYYDTYWFSFNPLTRRWIRPELQANASGFYGNLLAVKRFWDAELASEGMMEVELPEEGGTNGTWLAQQAVFSVVRSMISRDNTWHPRYGVLPGYGISLQDGFQDVFTSTATATLEWGAIPYARGVIDNWLTYYVRNDGMVTYRAEELAQSGRMLTLFALYHRVTGDDTLLLRHFGKIRAVAEWLLYRYNASVSNFPPSDPRHGVVAGGDEGDTFVAYYETHGSDEHLPHVYACAAAAYRGFTDVGAVWRDIGASANRSDVLAHATELLSTAPKILAAVQASLAKTTVETGNPLAPRCVPTAADPSTPPVGCLGDFRGYPELMYTGVLTEQQADDVFLHLAYGNSSDLPTRPMTLGCTGYNNKQTTYTAYGMAFGLLQHGMVERFLLHYFGMSAHTYTRGSWTTPEAVHPDRDVGSTDYAAAGVHTAPTYLKWALVFEEPNTETVVVGAALPRAWLEVGQPGVVVRRATTRYGRISFTVRGVDGDVNNARPSQGADADNGDNGYRVVANVSLPPTYAATAAAPPAGGVVLRLRTPQRFRGRMTSVTVGGAPWAHASAANETVVFPPESLTASVLRRMGDIVVTYKAPLLGH